MAQTSERPDTTPLTGPAIKRPTLHHYGLTTTRMDQTLEWYGKVIGTEAHLVPETTLPGSEMRAAFVSNDDAHHRIAIFSIPGVEVDPNPSRHTRVQHIAWAYESLADLLDSYDRIRGLGIEPQLCLDHGPSIAFYYRDPEGNVVELLADNQSGRDRDAWRMAGNPLGAFVDPDRVLQAHRAGATDDELHRRAFAGEFAPAAQPDIRILL